jgi:hypothetical protein
MKHSNLILVGMAMVASIAAAAHAQDAPGPAVATIGWVDRDNDGRHDLYRDLEGDGVNDATGLPYAHRFAWADLDGDGLNDDYRDADGDGVNDLDTKFLDRDGDGRDENVLDLDGDERNDITGLAYSRDDLHGDRFGYLREGTPWVDEDGDGFADSDQPDKSGRGRADRFIDRDGDGMADGCWFEDGGFRHHRARTGQGGGNGGSGGGTGGGGNGFGYGGGAGS